MQKIFTVKGDMMTYIQMGKNYPFPPPPLKRCHKCRKNVQFKKHGFYRRFLVDTIFKDKIYIRRYICPSCGHTISYLPSFCLPRFIYGLEHIFSYTYHSFSSSGTLTSCLEKLNAINQGLGITRKLLYHYRKRVMENLKLIQTGLRQMNPKVKLPDSTMNKKERAKKLLMMIKDAPDRVDSFSQKFYETTNKTILALCR